MIGDRCRPEGEDLPAPVTARAPRACPQMPRPPVLAEALDVAGQEHRVRAPALVFRQLTARIASSFRHLRSAASCLAAFDTSVM